MPLHPLVPDHLREQIVVVEGPLTGDPERLDPSEWAAVSSAVPARQLAFASGRSYARRALQACGISAAVIPANNHRAPVWPSGIVGSIAHTRRWAIAAVANAPADTVAGLGVDVETVSRVSIRVGERITTEAERVHADNPELRAVIFSVKEAVYKAQHPLLGLPLGFRDVTLDLDPANNSARTQVGDLDLEARWFIDQDRVTSLVVATGPATP